MTGVVGPRTTSEVHCRVFSSDQGRPWRARSTAAGPGTTVRVRELPRANVSVTRSPTWSGKRRVRHAQKPRQSHS